MIPFDARTGFLDMSAMSLVMALAIWIVLSGQRTRAVQFWCAGGVASAVASLLFALRGVVPELLSQTLATLLVFVLIVLKIQSLRLEAGDPEPWYRLVLLTLGFFVVFVSSAQCRPGTVRGIDYDQGYGCAPAGFDHAHRHGREQHSLSALPWIARSGTRARRRPPRRARRKANA